MKEARIRVNIISKYGIYFVLLGMILLLSVGTDSFFTVKNVLNVLRQISMNAILALGMTFVIISDGIDLSVASTVALAGVLAGSFAHPGEYPIIVPILVAAGLGLSVGLCNGLTIAYSGIPPFIVTLGFQQIVRGVAFIFTNGTSVINFSKPYKYIGQGVLADIPFPIYLLVLVAIIAYLVLQKTKYGRHIYATGGNIRAAAVSGINVKKIKTSVYVISGLCAGIVGLILTSRTNSSNPNVASGDELDAIAAAVIGGTSMSGGKGTILGTLVGALLIGILNNGLDLINVSSYIQQVVKGAIIIAAVLIDRMNETKK
ncbi:MAG: ABC transporter permease [Flexilinea sp.]